MKKLPLLLFLLSLFFASCSMRKDLKNSSDDNTKVIYGVKTDSSVIIYRDQSNKKLEFKNPISIEDVEQYGIDPSIITSVQSKEGMSRYVNGESNDTYEIDWLEFVLNVILVFVLGAWLFSD